MHYLNDCAGFVTESVSFKELKLCKDTGIMEMIKPGDKVAIKVQMGEYATPSRSNFPFCTLCLHELTGRECFLF